MHPEAQPVEIGETTHQAWRREVQALERVGLK